MHPFTIGYSASKVLHSQVNFVSSSSNVNSSDTQQRCQTIWETVHVDKSNLQDEEYAALEALTKEYADLFALTSMQIGRTDLVHHTINTGDNAPVKQPPLRTPFTLRPKVEEMVSEMLHQYKNLSVLGQVPQFWSPSQMDLPVSVLTIVDLMLSQKLMSSHFPEWTIAWICSLE